MCEVQVSFAFLTSRTVECCCNVSSSSKVSSRASQLRCADHSSRRVVHVKLLDFEAGCSRAFCVSCPVSADICALFDALSRSENASAVEYVGFVLATCSSGSRTHLAVSRILSLQDSIPDFLLCQRVSPEERLKRSFIRWLVVNVFVCSGDGELFVGHVPVLVPLTAEDVGKAAVLVATARVLCLSAECEALLRNCVVVACSNNGRKLTMEGPWQDACGAEQVAVIYNAAEVGDVVVVSAQWHSSADRGRTPIVQGVVTRRYVQDGLMLFEVKEVDTSVVMERLTCTQFVPL
ncbi:hypothetical protein ABL78_5461 [Leptomonas seymouri]|uniref:Uncharacterized protein n=1 Tax=Leptomonas seymouri TaxID=5684 RepID=A0A0N1IJU6_LEPSE|nr:hypothetical protein ABL78_5461 [Leptomonas seymouri]|eukprot:KPI85500.1 hypothetical protein ABL78_5461 [Leptomonas seymouri]